MKNYFTLLVLLIPFFAGAQGQVWQVPIVHNNIQLRGPEATTLGTITMDVPLDGQVFVRFEGNCSASRGDRIVLAASNYNDWVTNDGNTDVYGFDSTLTKQCFNHTRIYPVTPGTYTWYAIGHNYVDIEGNGIASIDGQLTVEYVPNESLDIQLAGSGILHSEEWDGTLKVFKQITVDAPVKGKILANFEGYAYLSNNDTVYLTTNLSANWPAHEEISHMNMNDVIYKQDFGHRKIYEVEAGTYEVYAMGVRTNGPGYDSGIYATLSAQFIPDDNPEAVMVSDNIPKTELNSGDYKSIAETNVVAPVEGKVWIQFTGEMNSTPYDSIIFSIIKDEVVDTVLSDQLVQTVIIDQEKTYFTLSGYAEVGPGNHIFKVYADFDPFSTGSGEAEVKGLMTAQFFGKPVTTAVGDLMDEGTDMAFYPNPTSGELYCRSNVEENGLGCELVLYDAAGKIIMIRNGHVASDLDIDMSELPEGFYEACIRQGEKSECHKIYRSSTGQ